MVKAVSAAINLRSVPHTLLLSLITTHFIPSVLRISLWASPNFTFCPCPPPPVGQCFIFWLLCFSIIWITLPAAQTGNQSYIARRNISKFKILFVVWHTRVHKFSCRFLQTTNDRSKSLSINNLFEGIYCLFFFSLSLSLAV